MCTLTRMHTHTHTIHPSISRPVHDKHTHTHTHTHTRTMCCLLILHVAVRCFSTPCGECGASRLQHQAFLSAPVPPTFSSDCVPTHTVDLFPSFFTPGLSSWGTESLGCTRSCRRLLMGRKVVLIPRGDRTRLMASRGAFDVWYGGRGGDSGGL